MKKYLPMCLFGLMAFFMSGVAQAAITLPALTDATTAIEGAATAILGMAVAVIIFYRIKRVFR